MKKAVKIWLIAAAVLIVLGVGTTIVALAAVNFDITKLSTVKYVTNTYQVKDKFDKIVIDEITSNIVFAKAEDKNCTVVCREPEKVSHSADVKDGTLTIKAIDNREWYDRIGLFFESPSITVYLPKKEYDSLTVNSDTGNITIPDRFSFKSAEIRTDAGNVMCAADVKKTFSVELSTGNIEAKDLSAGSITLSASTGNVKLGSVSVDKDITVTTDTGNIRMENTTAKGGCQLQTVTGNVKLDGCDADHLSVKTDTGNIDGVLLSPKCFITSTDTGNIDVPNTFSGGRCELKTDTGNIRIKLQ